MFFCQEKQHVTSTLTEFFNTLGFSKFHSTTFEKRQFQCSRVLRNHSGIFLRFFSNVMRKPLSNSLTPLSTEIACFSNDVEWNLENPQALKISLNVESHMLLMTFSMQRSLFKVSDGHKPGNTTLTDCICRQSVVNCETQGPPFEDLKLFL